MKGSVTLSSLEFNCFAFLTCHNQLLFFNNLLAWIELKKYCNINEKDKIDRSVFIEFQLLSKIVLEINNSKIQTQQT